jgi:hypothetical protein
VRSQQTDHPNPFPHPEGDSPMHETLHQNDVDHLVHDRIGDLYATARELHVGRRTPAERLGLVTRTRATIGRRIVSIGHTVSGQAA